MPLTAELRQKYRPTIGIECHIQLKTKTKLFSAVGNDARDAAPNTLISHIDVGMPGALPVLNEKALELAVRAAFVLNTEPQRYSYFERKHYFYPDSPSGYQISQLNSPIIIGGSVDIAVGGQTKTVSINRVQLEADAGKTTHPAGADYSLVDLNRAGTPLIEVVSEPDIHSAAEAKAYARELYLLMKYADISNVDLYHGNMRFDVNVSVSAQPGALGKRSEVKNLNSFRSVEAAIEYEIERQIDLLERGEPVEQETRGWDEAKQKTTMQRGKEEAHDYRYFPDPDLPPVELSDEYIKDIGASIPDLPKALREKFISLNLGSLEVETILDEPDAAEILVKTMQDMEPAASRTIANWLIGDIRRMVNEGEASWKGVSNVIQQLSELASMVAANKISSTAAKNILSEVVKSAVNPAEFAKTHGMLQVSDEAAIQKIVSEVIADNPKAAEDVARGEMKAIGFLVGQVMAKSKGQANPGVAQQIIKRQLGV